MYYVVLLLTVGTLRYSDTFTRWSLFYRTELNRTVLSYYSAQQNHTHVHVHKLIWLHSDLDSCLDLTIGG